MLPGPMPMKARPPLSSSILAAAFAVTAGWMLNGSTTPWPMPMRSVAIAATVIMTWTSRAVAGVSTRVR